MKETLINLEYLHRTCGGSEEMIQMILDMFVASTPDCIQELEQHFNNRDSESLRSVAHKVKSSFMTIGASSTGEKLQTIEDAAKENEIDHLEQLINEIKQESDAIIQELNHKNKAA